MAACSCKQYNTCLIVSFIGVLICCLSALGVVTFNFSSNSIRITFPNSIAKDETPTSTGSNQPNAETEVAEWSIITAPTKGSDCESMGCTLMGGSDESMCPLILESCYLLFGDYESVTTCDDNDSESSNCSTDDPCTCDKFCTCPRNNGPPTSAKDPNAKKSKYTPKNTEGIKFVKYSTITHGTCGSGTNLGTRGAIPSETMCTDAAPLVLKLADLALGDIEDDFAQYADKPSGCFWDKNSEKLYFNGENSNKPATEDQHVICMFLGGEENIYRHLSEDKQMSIMKHLVFQLQHMSWKHLLTISGVLGVLLLIAIAEFFSFRKSNNDIAQGLLADYEEAVNYNSLIRDQLRNDYDQTDERDNPDRSAHISEFQEDVSAHRNQVVRGPGYPDDFSDVDPDIIVPIQPVGYSQIDCIEGWSDVFTTPHPDVIIGLVPEEPELL